MASIFKRNRVWYLDVRFKGKRIRKRVGTSKKLAELALKDAEVKIVRDEFGFSKNDISIDKLIDKFLEYNRTNHRPSTTKRYKAVMDHLKLFLNEKRSSIVFVSQLTSELFEEYKTFRRDAWINPNGHVVEDDSQVTKFTRKGARARTVNIELEGIRAMLNLSIKWDYLKENPMKHVKMLKVDDKKPFRFLSKEECDKFLDATPTYLYPIYFTFLSSGMRKAELENLLWGDVDFKNRKIYIRKKPSWQPKTGEREIPLSDELLNILKEHKKGSKESSASNYVFDIIGSGRSMNMLRTELIKIAKVADIEEFTMVHTLRHTFASHLVMGGVDLPTIQKLMGHSDIETTMIYAHLAPDHLSSAVNKLPY